MVKLQKRFSRKVNDKDYYKYIINIPPKLVKEANLKGGQEVKLKAEKGKITITK